MLCSVLSASPKQESATACALQQAYHNVWQWLKSQEVCLMFSLQWFVCCALDPLDPVIPTYISYCWGQKLVLQYLLWWWCFESHLGICLMVVSILLCVCEIIGHWGFILIFMWSCNGFNFMWSWVFYKTLFIITWTLGVFSVLGSFCCLLLSFFSLIRFSFYVTILSSSFLFF